MIKLGYYDRLMSVSNGGTSAVHISFDHMDGVTPTGVRSFNLSRAGVGALIAALSEIMNGEVENLTILVEALSVDAEIEEHAGAA